MHINGFAKQNYTMLDNLKLGYGGTKTEMERLLADAQKITGIKYDISNLSDVYQAIHIIQGELGITGTTAKEATETLQGSMASMKASWSNFLSGSGNLNQVVGTATDVVKNVVRIVNKAIPDIMNTITDSFPELLGLGNEILQQFIKGLVTNLPQLITSAGQIIDSLIQGILMVIPQLIPVSLQIIQSFILGLFTYLPQIVEMGMQLIPQLIVGIAQMLPTLIPQAANCIITIVEGLLNNIDLLIDAAIQLIMALADGIIEALPILIEKAPEIIQKLFDAFIRNFPKIVKAGGELIGKLVAGITGAFWKLLEVAPQLIANIVKGLSAGWNEMKNTGKYLIEGLWDGIKGMAGWVGDKVKSFAVNILNNMKESLGIHSPSTKARDLVGKFIPSGIAVGIEANTDEALRAIDNMNDEIMSEMNRAVAFETGSINAKASVKSNNSMLNVIQATFNIDGSVDIDGQKAGRIMTPYMSKTLRTGGAY